MQQKCESKLSDSTLDLFFIKATYNLRLMRTPTINWRCFNSNLFVLRFLFLIFLLFVFICSLLTRLSLNQFILMLILFPPSLSLFSSSPLLFFLLYIYIFFRINRQKTTTHCKFFGYTISYLRMHS